MSEAGFNPTPRHHVTEMHGAYWYEEPDWKVVRQWHDDKTGLLAIICKHDSRAVLRASLCERHQADGVPSPLWSDLRPESIFAADDIDEATRHLEALLLNCRAVP